MRDKQSMNVVLNALLVELTTYIHHCYACVHLVRHV